MAISQNQEQSPSSLLEALYCEEEEQWEEEELFDDDGDEEEEIGGRKGNNDQSLLPLMLLEQDLFWEDEELLTLFTKEKQGRSSSRLDLSLSSNVRREKVEWMLRVNAHYGFCTLTSVLAVDYFDRFVSSFPLHDDKPWMFQLAAVTCVSLAAKVEETHVPLLLDLQVEGTKYVFEAKTIQKMELLVLSTLEWRMNPVTPLSFLDHIIRRLGLKNDLHWEFLRRCERLLLSVLPEWRVVRYEASVLAAATMMQVIEQIEPCNSPEYQNQLLAVLNISKGRVSECYRLMEELSTSGSTYCNGNPTSCSSKRKFEQMMNNNVNANLSDNHNIVPSSPSGVIDASYNYLSSGDSSNDSWAAGSASDTSTSAAHVNGSSSSLSSSLSSPLPSPSSSSVSSSPSISRKRGRAQAPLQLPSLSRVFVDVVGSPR